MKYFLQIPGSDIITEIDASSHEEAVTHYLRYLLGFSLGSIITVVSVQSQREHEPILFLNHVKLEIFMQRKNHNG